MSHTGIKRWYLETTDFVFIRIKYQVKNILNKLFQHLKVVKNVKNEGESGFICNNHVQFKYLDDIYLTEKVTLVSHNVACINNTLTSFFLLKT